MPQRDQPAALFELALPAAALNIRMQCDDILHRNDGDVTAPAFKQQIESLNEQLLREVPFTVLDRLRLEENLELCVYRKARSLTVNEETQVGDPMYKHLTLNVFPCLDSVTHLELIQVEGSLALFRSISVYCQQLRSIYLNTSFGPIPESLEEIRQTGDNWCVWLLLLTSCKKLRIINDLQSEAPGFPMLVNTPAHKSVIAALLRELPDLRVFTCLHVLPTFTASLETDVYRLTSLFVDYFYFQTAAEVNWVDKHCPHVVEIVWRVDKETQYDSAFEALAESNLKLEAITFPGVVPKFSEAVKRFFVNRGEHVRRLMFYYESETWTIPETALSFDDVLHLSRFCPGLKSLTLEGFWYNGELLFAEQSRSNRLFPKLEYLKCDYFESSRAIPVMLRELPNVETVAFLTPAYDGDSNNVLDLFESGRNEFRKLTGLEIEVYEVLGEGGTCDFLKRIVPIAMKWPNINSVYIAFSDETSTDAARYVEEIQCKIREQNLYVELVVEFQANC